MISKNSLFKAFSTLALITIVFVTLSCSQQQKKVAPATSEELPQVAAQQIKVPIDGMVCMACQSTIKKAIKSLPGVKNVEVSLENKNALITYYPNLVKPEQFQKAINDKGYTAGKTHEVKQ